MSRLRSVRPGRGVPEVARASDWSRMVALSHSVFALPFALLSAWLAGGGMPEPAVLALVVLCAVAARTAAMAFNRWLDRGMDARNPRTKERELPRGIVAPRAALGLVALSSLVFIGAAFALNPLCGWLSPPVLAVLLGYSAFKRFHWAGHLVLGLALSLAPLGAWLAVRGSFAGDLWVPLLLAGAVFVWVAGFDLIYACQDEAFDAAHGLHSIPARFGTARALQLSSFLHVLTVGLFILFGLSAGLGLGFGLALLVATTLLVWQHRLVSPHDLSRVDRAFFTMNGWVSVALFLGVWVDLFFLGKGLVDGGTGI